MSAARTTTFLQAEDDKKIRLWSIIFLLSGKCLETGVSPRCHLEDITRSDIYGFVIPFCLELMNLMKEYQIPVKIRVCDTMGYGVNYPGA